MIMSDVKHVPTRASASKCLKIKCRFKCRTWASVRKDLQIWLTLYRAGVK